MKIKFLLLSAVLLFISPAFAADATFQWTANTDSTDGYKIHYGGASGVYTEVVDVGKPETKDGKVQGDVTGLIEGKTYFFAATAYNAYEESAFSNEVEHVFHLNAPMIFEIAGAKITILAEPIK